MCADTVHIFQKQFPKNSTGSPFSSPKTNRIHLRLIFLLLFDYTYQIRPDLRKDYHLQLTIQFGQNQITARMESLINNPGFDNITKKIFLLLDHETLLTCRLVCKSFKTKVEDCH